MKRKYVEGHDTSRKSYMKRLLALIYIELRKLDVSADEYLATPQGTLLGLPEESRVRDALQSLKALITATEDVDALVRYTELSLQFDTVVHA